jgi:glycosyltransferase involved in cell wall biosynthesis
MTASKASITAIILSFNEELHIGRCIERLWPVVERIVVIDSYSTDRTVEIARSLGADVLQNPWSNHANQFNWALDNVDVSTDWIMRIDCDEYLETGLQAELAGRLHTLPADVTACDFKLKVIFQGQFIRWGGYYRTWLTRLWRTGMGRYESRWMDEKILVEAGERIQLGGGDLVDENLKDLTWWTAKHNDYATRQMIDYINREHQFLGSVDPLEKDANRAIRHKRMLRSAYAGMPLYLRTVLYFLLRYVFRLGFLDGRKGFVWHVLQGFWYFLLVDAKVDEARAFIAMHGIEAFRAHVAERYGFADLAPLPPGEQARA